MDTSILRSTKKILGITAEDTSFDLDIITHINSAFSILTQLGLGPAEGFMIEDEDAIWDDFLVDMTDHDARYIRYTNLVRTCVYLRVRLLFDPPSSSYLIDAYQKQLLEHEWRLSTMREEDEYVPPIPG